MLVNLIQDIRYTVRTLAKSSSFALTSIATLAIGIGAATAIFSMVNGVLVQRLPMANGDRLVHFRQPSARSSDEGLSALEVTDLRRDTHDFSAVAEYHTLTFQLYGHGDPLRVTTGVVSDGFFDMLGVKPALGRTFRPGEEAVSAAPVVVLSHSFWMNQFHGDSSVVGARFTMNDRVHTVIGVLPPLPGYPEENDVWMPIGACPFRTSWWMSNTRDHRMLRAFGIRRPDVPEQEAASELSTLSARAHATYPAAYPAALRINLVATNARDEMTKRAKPVLYMLIATAVFLLLVAVANAATLSLSRQLRRSREMAVRVALGGSGARLYRQLALESLMLSVGGAALGVAIASSGLGLLRTFATRFTPRADEITISGPVFLFAAALCVIIALAVAAVPFLHVHGRRDLAGALRVGNAGSGATPREHRVRGILVAAQVALAFVMLVGGGLIGRSLITLERVDAGVDVRSVLTAQLELNFTKYDTPAKQTNFARALIERLDAVPGARSTAVASALPLQTSGMSEQPFAVDRVSELGAGSPPPHAEVTTVSPDYFRTVGIPLVRGRAFTPLDRDTLTAPAIVSERLVEEYWRGRDPIGTRITFNGGRTWREVVGVVGNVRHRLADPAVTDAVYLPILASSSLYDLRVFVRAAGPLPAVEQAVRAVVRDVDPQQPVSDVETLEQARGAQLVEPRLTTTLVGVFAVLALVLTATGLSGVVAFGVAQRLPEIAIRVALGATRRRVLALVVREGLVIVVVGLFVGSVASIATRGVVSHLLFGVRATDAATYAAVVLTILGTAAAACAAPSWRALKAEPARILRGG
jgi:putative ABC transport system permease protein